MKLGPRSVTFRVIAVSTVWAIAMLVVVATIISTLYRQASEHSFQSLLQAHLFNLISSVSVSDSGSLVGAPDLGDLRFSIPRSGWYWSVTPVSKDLTGELRSISMTGPIASPSVQKVPFNSDFQRHYTATGLAGEQIEAVESEFVLDTKNRVARFRVIGNRSELDSDIARFDDKVYAYLALFGAGMIAINAIAILIGLRPLDRVRKALARVRKGEATRLDGTFPAEIEPLANETNALIENNRRIVERARTQVGNLAHSLKTPLAILLNESRQIGGEKGHLVGEQAAAMQQQVDHYLQRARIAAQRDSVVFRTQLKPLLERLVRVMLKLNPDARIALSLPAEDVKFAGESEDFEEITGNLLENAVKWAGSQVKVALTPASGGPGGDMFMMAIEDDGPGIPEDKAREVLKRGRRLDETKPGSGLGLSIVHDLIREYDGKLDLERSSLGGLRVVVLLRQAH
jgi:signal transduction histidine kinase